ncbi:hypothetical protein [Kribbella sp. NPDC006257]|uniref:hypothetical protein n=1 Tax=Kribbella sp. NPDC006257 TaxID=3156738 RepID=UPI0033B760D3
MALQFANTIPARLLMWQRVREYAVPLSMIETATERRAVGDWAGACAAARVDVDLDLRAVRDRYGTEFVACLRADLRRLAPDLLRWHMPRIFPDGLLRPGLTVSLIRYRTGTTPLELVVRTPPTWASAGQRMSLTLWEGSGTPSIHPHPHPSRRFRLDLYPHLWDSTRYAELATRCALADAPQLNQPGQPGQLNQPGRSIVDDGSWAFGRWAVEAELLFEAEGLPQGPFTVRLGRRRYAVLELVAPDGSHAPTYRPLREVLPLQQIAALPMLPEAAVRVLPDLELLRAGLIPPDHLHPLVAQALTASAKATDPKLAAVLETASQPRPAAAPAPAVEPGSQLGRRSATGPGFHPGATDLIDHLSTLTVGLSCELGSTIPVDGGLQVGDPHSVVCRGEVHRIGLRDGVLVAVDHDAVEVRREELLVALGGPALPCLRAIDAVHREPAALPSVRGRIDHGDVAGALTVVEGLLGPSAILRDGPLRDELELAAARRVHHGLFRSGLAELPASGGAMGGWKSSDSGRAERVRRPRSNRRTPAGMYLKQNSRQRPRVVLA